MGVIITAPEDYRGGYSLPSLFLAGGISNCPDWQGPVATQISNNSNAVIINPRRENWDMDADLEESKKQIIWEHSHLHNVDSILFWFPEETLCPITLLELGAQLDRMVNLIIGCHPNYERKFDVEVQTKLARPFIEVFDNLDEMVDFYLHDLALSQLA